MPYNARNVRTRKQFKTKNKNNKNNLVLTLSDGRMLKREKQRIPDATTNAQRQWFKSNKP